MIDTLYRKKFLKVNQIWYPGNMSVSALLGQKRKADILFVHGVSVEETKGSFRGWQKYYTCMNNLSLPEEELFVGINKNVRYECRRSERDDIEICFYKKADIEADRNILEKFADIYEKMYQSKGIKANFNRAAIEKYMETDSVRFSAVWHQGEMIVFHAYICDKEDTRLLYSASCFREESAANQNMIGRANKRLQWEDMKYFKREGMLRYDWGGISDFNNPNGIDEFKLKFGGDKIMYYNVLAGNTLLGKFAITIMKIMKRVS